MIDFYSNLYYDLLISYDISVNEDYIFVHEKFLELLIQDTNKLINKDFNKKFIDSSNSDEENLKMIIFKSVLYKNLVNGWYERLKYPEKFSEYTREIRMNKINKIYGCK